MIALTLLLATAITPPEGPWRLESQKTSVRVLSWGLFCGAEPKTSRGIPGAVYTLRNQGDGFTLGGAGKSLGTEGCSMDPTAFKLRQRNRNADVIHVECEAPPVAGNPVVTLHRFEILSPTEIRYVTSGEKRKNEGLDSCRYAYEMEMVFKAATEAGPCAQPGPAAKLVLDPAARDAAPAERVCFKVQAVDAKGCAVPSGSLQFSVEPANAGTMDGQQCFWVAREVGSTLVAAVTATQGSAVGNAVVRVLVAGEAPKETLAETAAKSTNQRIRTLVSEVLAGEFVLKTPMEQFDEDPLPAPPAPPPPGLRTYVVYGALGGGGVALVLLGIILVLRARKRPPQVSPPPPQPLQPIQAPEVKPPEAGSGYRCPRCGFQYEQPGKCIHDGTELVVLETKGRQTLFIPSFGGMVCLTCGQRYPRNAKFCGNDRTPLVPDIPGLTVPENKDKPKDG